MTETILSIFSIYGAPALFVIVAAGQFGIPLPTSILLLTAGALQANGDLSFWQIFIWALAGAVTGDHLGYGRRGEGGQPERTRALWSGREERGGCRRSHRTRSRGSPAGERSHEGLRPGVCPARPRLRTVTPSATNSFRCDSTRCRWPTTTGSTRWKALV